MIFLFIHSLSASFDHCQKEFNAPIMTRCILRVGEHANFSNAYQTAFYVHSKNRNSLIELTPLVNSRDKHTVKAGKGAQIGGSQIELTCLNSDCYLSIWHTDYDKNGANYVSDVPGCTYSAQNKILPKRYPSFFDFGGNTSIDVKKFDHNRKPGLSLTLYDKKTGKEVEFGKGSEFEINSTYIIDTPGIIHISSSKFKGLNITIIVGTRVKLDDGFSNSLDDGYGMFEQFTWHENTKTFTTKTPELGNFITIIPYKEKRVFYILSIVFYGLDGLIFLVSFLYLIIVKAKMSHKRNDKMVGMSIEQDSIN